MNLLKMIAPPTRQGGQIPSTEYYQDRQAWIRGNDPDGPTHKENQVAWWYGGLGKIARLVSAAKFQVTEYKDEAHTPVVDHRIERALHHPNALQSWREILYRWTLSMHTYGEAFLFVAPGKTTLAEVGEIQLIHPSLIEVKGSPKAAVEQYLYYPKGKGPGKKVERIPREQIIMSRFPDPRDISGVRGLAPLEAAHMGITGDYLKARWGNNFFGKSGGLPQALVAYPSGVNEKTAKKIEDTFVSMTSDGRRDPVVVPAGQLDIKVLDFEPDKMGFDTLRTMDRQQIEYTLGLPEGHASGDANRANASNARIALIDSLVWPLVELLVADFNTQWPMSIGGWDPIKNRFQAEEMRQKDEEQHDKQQRRRESTWSINEIRAEDGKDPVDVKALVDLFPKIEDDKALEALFSELPAKVANDVLAALVKPKKDPPPNLPPAPGGPPGPPDPNADPGADPNADPGKDPGTDPPNPNPPDPGKTDPADMDPDARAYRDQVLEMAAWRQKATKAASDGEPLPTDFRTDHLPGYIADGIRTDLAADGASDRVSLIFRDWMEAL